MHNFTLWLTGLSGSGKSTIAEHLLKTDHKLGERVIHLDGDQVRKQINSDLQFSEKDRLENIRRIASIALLLNQQNCNVIVTAITPTNVIRSIATSILQHHCYMVWVDCPIHTCEQRDPKTLYKKARAGLIANFTGISAKFEYPDKYDLRIPTDQNTIEESVEILKAFASGISG